MSKRVVTTVLGTKVPAARQIASVVMATRCIAGYRDPEFKMWESLVKLLNSDTFISPQVSSIYREADARAFLKFFNDTLSVKGHATPKMAGQAKPDASASVPSSEPLK